jgi:endogenous inhibitor of DNA gyrase (YacG/DUF329 family)
MQRCEHIDLEALSLSFVHADYVIKCENFLVVVEETESSKLEDINALERTIEWVKTSYKMSANEKIYAVIHYHKRSDSKIPVALLSKTQSMQRRGWRVVFATFRCRDMNDLVHWLTKEYNLSIVL